MQVFAVVLAVLALLDSTESLYWRRPAKYYTTRYNERRGHELKEDTLKKHLADPNAIIIDTRPHNERESYDLTDILGVDTKAKIILVAYNTIYDRQHFFEAFDPTKTQFDSDNGDTDTNIFASLMPANFDYDSKTTIPQAVSEMGKTMSVVCGSQWCGCRWNLMYDHGFRGHAWYDDNINDFILSQRMTGGQERRR